MATPQQHPFSVGIGGEASQTKRRTGCICWRRGVRTLWGAGILGQGMGTRKGSWLGESLQEAEGGCSHRGVVEGYDNRYTDTKGWRQGRCPTAVGADLLCLSLSCIVATCRTTFRAVVSSGHRIGSSAASLFGSVQSVRSSLIGPFGPVRFSPSQTIQLGLSLRAAPHALQ